MSPIRIAVAGGNYAGLNAVKQLYASLLAPTVPEQTRPKVEITLIDKRDGFLHYIGITRGFTEPEFGNRLWVPYASVPWLQHPSVSICHDAVTKITPSAIHLASNMPVPFDYLVIALGETRATPIGAKATTKKEFSKDIDHVYRQIKGSNTVVVVGAGAVGIEMAADIKCDFGEKRVILAHSRALPLPGPFSDAFRGQVVDILKDIGVDVMLGQRVVNQSPDSSINNEVATEGGYSLTLADGRQITADCVIRCLGTSTGSTKQLIDLPVPESAGAEPLFGPHGIRVKDTMQIDCPLYPNIYACGDICARNNVKLAGVAMYGGYVAARNIARSVLRINEQLEKSPQFPSKIMLLLGKDNFALQYADEIWEKERVKQFITDDMGLQLSIDALSLNSTPEYDDLKIKSD
ncbi:hypothetical protein IW140_005319 [Coemansia sp. RSA 1813]|nr:hypothetical protein EV178_005257 [Coemansia sp. RSA 1646]KAJ1769838.1 hypothetical protein LPJ74_003685 [Coemansia sp. RSA 1843]KAJ2087027.1 hypothetical protein IW138_005246 [Coemansia sp. RSA 986]KAJ2211860.1 hypothetical protein EV179_005151 [Coemansia sp. RSA 487]KAJ2565511.1 hypothetical protein IW140_005319 [Coemansia sp. RSA 1813]